MLPKQGQWSRSSPVSELPLDRGVEQARSTFKLRRTARMEMWSLYGRVCQEAVAEGESMEHARELFCCYAALLEHSLNELIWSIWIRNSWRSKILKSSFCAAFFVWSFISLFIFSRGFFRPPPPPNCCYLDLIRENLDGIKFCQSLKKGRNQLLHGWTSTLQTDVLNRIIYSKLLKHFRRGREGRGGGGRGGRRRGLKKLTAHPKIYFWG